MGKIQRALVSVSDKNGVVAFARGLSALGVEIISTGGTAALLRQEKIPVKDVRSEERRVGKECRL